MSSLSRREFIKKSSMGVALGTAAGLSMASKSYANIAGANRNLNIALLGCNRRYRPIIDLLPKIPNVTVHTVCDVNAKNLNAALVKAQEVLGYTPKSEVDLRKVVENKEIDAVFILLPDHWHAYGTYLALEHGKHVYVEKPCSHNPREGEMFGIWQEKYGKVIQMGNQQRSAPESIELMTRIHEGEIGDVYMAKAFYSNDRPRVPNPKAVPVPSHLNWELFQGPAPRRPFWDIIEDYNWHWYWHWGTAETGNNAAHELDIARWALQVSYPEKVSCISGKFHYPDDGMNTYDTMEASFHFPNHKIIQWDGKSRNAYSTYGAYRGTIMYGTHGSAFVNRSGYKLYNRSNELIGERSTEVEVDGTALGGSADSTALHVLNFFDAIRDQVKQNSPIDEGAVSIQLCHYANIASRENDLTFEVDSTSGEIKDPSLMKKYWSRQYEDGWEPKV